MGTNNYITTQTIDYVKEQLSGAEAGHNWFHIERVWKLSKTIAQAEGGDIQIVELAALLHDIADPKFHDGDEEKGPQMATNFLISIQVHPEVIHHVEQIIRNISFAGGNNIREFHSLELDIVQDADRLDAIGAIGIARAFNYGGYKGREMYDPAIPPRMNMTKAEYRTHVAPTINHFYEKLLLLKDRMNTDTGKTMAEDRHRYMEDFLTRFYNEWEGRM